MADIKKIYRGMQNGAETIDSNFQNINNEVKIGVKKTGDEDISGKKNFTDDAKFKNIELSGSLKSPGDTKWVNLSPGTGVLVPSGAVLMYRIKAGFITIVASNVQTTIDDNGSKQLTSLPVSLFDKLTYVAAAFTGNAVNSWRVGIFNELLLVSGTASIRSDNISFSVTLPLN